MGRLHFILTDIATDHYMSARTSDPHAHGNQCDVQLGIIPSCTSH